MAADFEVRQSSNGEWCFYFRSSDGRILATGEGYRT
jgi:uncharacterized protein YegP (UPF0339 family)